MSIFARTAGALLCALAMVACSSNSGGDTLPGGQTPGPPGDPDQGDVVYTAAGLIEPDGSPHAIPEPHGVSGRTLDVLDYGADPADNANDDAAAIRAALAAAEPGDEVYLPNGVYNLRSTLTDDASAHFALRTAINLRGESQDGAVLVASVHGDGSRLAKATGVHDIRISNLLFTSDWRGRYSADTHTTNPDAGGPQTQLYITDHNGVPSQRISVDHATFEKFQRMGVRIQESNTVVVSDSLFRNATDVAGGGAGYGVDIQGLPKTDLAGQPNDALFNVVRNNDFEGPYIRHGALIQYYSHNNLIIGNRFRGTALDAIDLHGEDEYLNEIADNDISGITGGAGIGVGNTGGTPPNVHDASGPGNLLHDNRISGSKLGIHVAMGSPSTVIENNTIGATALSNARGILLENAPCTAVRGNHITGITGSRAWGLVAQHDVGDVRQSPNLGKGDPRDLLISGNVLYGNANGMQIPDVARGVLIENNQVSGSAGTDLDIEGALVAATAYVCHASDEDAGGTIRYGFEDESVGATPGAAFTWAQAVVSDAQARAGLHSVELSDSMTDDSGRLRFSARPAASGAFDVAVWVPGNVDATTYLTVYSGGNAGATNRVMEVILAPGGSLRVRGADDNEQVEVGRYRADAWNDVALSWQDVDQRGVYALRLSGELLDPALPVTLPGLVPDRIEIKYGTLAATSATRVYVDELAAFIAPEDGG